MARMSFTPAPGVNVSDADAAVGDVKDGKFFYSVEQPRKEGTMPTEAIAAGAETYAPGYHAGNVGGLSAIDADLAVGNIKKDVDIFGVTGTFENTVATTEVFWDSPSGTICDTGWTDLANLTGNVLDTAKRVEAMIDGLVRAGGGNGDLRILYNDVEKATVGIGETSPMGCRWEGEALGSTVVLHMEGKLDSGSEWVDAAGCCWFQTLS